ncbi:hypothetical protein K501DRAFT_338106 [Backusella circina FSU 941]|nr:hypothetical protein K501DRAFT_338106 [Backusella circina FSU 941]
MPLNESSVTKGWLQKACRFSLRHTLKVRYFVLSDSELRYYKHTTDMQPAGIITLKNFHSVHIQNTTPLYGFKITSEYKNQQWSPTLYADSHEERNMWMKEIQTRLNRIQSNMSFTSLSSTSTSVPRRHSIHDHHHHHHHHHHSGMIDRWLDKFDLGDKQQHHVYNHHQLASRSSMDTPTPQRSLDSLDESIYSEASTVNNDSRTFVPHSLDSSILSLDTKSLSTSPTFSNLEMERVIYLSHTTNRRSKTNQFHSEPIIPLSPPPPPRR